MDQTELIGLKKLIEIEKKLNLWEYCIDGVHPWALIRGNVLLLSLNANQSFCQAHAKSNLTKYLSPKLVLDLFKTMRFFISERKKFDSLFFTTARYQKFNYETSVYNDQFYKPYFSMFSNPLIFEHSYQGTVKQPRELELNTYILDYIPIITTLKSYKIRINTNKYEKDILDFIFIICNSFSLHNEMSNLYKKLIRRFHAKQYLINYIDSIIFHMNDNKAFIHCASYLNDNGLITKRLKEKGIITIEIQHGYIGSNHYAYNYPTGHAKSIAKEYLPDYYLTYGKYWTEQIQTPSTVVSVGNPSLNAAKDQYEETSNILPRSILIVSQGTVTPTMVKIAKYLSQTFPKYTIMYKLHPGEVPFTDRYDELRRYPNIQIKTYENIYDLIAMSEIIIGYYSTTLFEAAAFKGKRIFILKNNLIPKSLGYSFTNCEELRDAILDESYGYPSADPSYFWEPDWNNNISKFLSQIS